MGDDKLSIRSVAFDLDSLYCGNIAIRCKQDIRLYRRNLNRSVISQLYKLTKNPDVSRIYILTSLPCKYIAKKLSSQLKHISIRSYRPHFDFANHVCVIDRCNGADLYVTANSNVIERADVCAEYSEAIKFPKLHTIEGQTLKSLSYINLHR